MWLALGRGGMHSRYCPHSGSLQTRAGRGFKQVNKQIKTSFLIMISALKEETGLLRYSVRELP